MLDDPPTVEVVEVIIRLGISNKGHVAAGKTGINLLVPDRYGPTLQWTRGDESSGNWEPVKEEIGVGALATRSAYIWRTIDRVSLSRHLVFQARFLVRDLERGETLEIPIRARVDADELPKPAREELLDATITISEPEMAALMAASRG